MIATKKNLQERRGFYKQDQLPAPEIQPGNDTGRITRVFEYRKPRFLDELDIASSRMGMAQGVWETSSARLITYRAQTN